MRNLSRRFIRQFFPLLFLFLFPSCILRNCRVSQEGNPYPYTRAENGDATASAPTRINGPLPHDYEEARMDKVFPDGSTTFDPFTFGRAGSPYGVNGPFSPAQTGGRCGPMTLPMSPLFADPGDSQAVILIFNNGQICQPDIDHDKPGAALTFSRVAAPFTSAPWTLVSNTGGKITIRDTGTGVTIRFTFNIGIDATTISSVEYL